MKNREIIIATCFISIWIVAIQLPTLAQDNNRQMSTLFGGKNGNIHHGGWGGLYFGYTQVSDKDTYLMGARGGWLINHRFTIGLAGCGFISDRDYYEIVPDKTVSLAGGYGGLFLEAVIFPFSPVHITIPLTIGAGGVAYTSNNWRGGDYSYENYTYDSDAYFLLEPGLEIELNLIKFMRFAVGGSYRYTSDVNMINSSPQMLQGFNGHFTLKFGSF
jgi:hypothetical protein